MFLRVKRRFKDGKEHRYWSIVENHRPQPDEDQKLLLHQLKLTLPKQPLPCLAVEGAATTKFFGLGELKGKQPAIVILKKRSD